MIHAKIRLQGGYSTSNDETLLAQVGTDRYHTHVTGDSPMREINAYIDTLDSNDCAFVDSLLGSDDNDGKTLETAYETFNKAVEAVVGGRSYIIINDSETHDYTPSTAVVGGQTHLVCDIMSTEGHSPVIVTTQSSNISVDTSIDPRLGRFDFAGNYDKSRISFVKVFNPGEFSWNPNHYIVVVSGTTVNSGVWALDTPDFSLGGTSANPTLANGTRIGVISNQSPILWDAQNIADRIHMIGGWNTTGENFGQNAGSLSSCQDIMITFYMFVPGSSGATSTGSVQYKNVTMQSIYDAATAAPTWSGKTRFLNTRYMDYAGMCPKSFVHQGQIGIMLSTVGAYSSNPFFWEGAGEPAIVYGSVDTTPTLIVGQYMLKSNSMFVHALSVQSYKSNLYAIETFARLNQTEPGTLVRLAPELLNEAEGETEPNVYFRSTPQLGGNPVVTTIQNACDLHIDPQTGECYVLTTDGKIFYTEDIESPDFSLVTDLGGSGWGSIQKRGQDIFTFNFGAQFLNNGFKAPGTDLQSRSGAAGVYKNGVQLQTGRITRYFETELYSIMTYLANTSDDQTYGGIGLFFAGAEGYAFGRFKSIKVDTALVVNAILSLDGNVDGIDIDGQRNSNAIFFRKDNAQLSHSRIRNCVNAISGSRQRSINITGCLIDDNGVGVYNFDNVEISNSLFVDNIVGIGESTEITLKNCTIVGNNFGVRLNQGIAIVEGSILYDNGIDCRSSGILSFKDSIAKRLESLDTPIEIIDDSLFNSNPLFRSADDYRLRTQAGGYNYDSPYARMLTQTVDGVEYDNIEIGAYMHSKSSTVLGPDYNAVCPIVWDTQQIEEVPVESRTVLAPNGEFFQWSPNEDKVKRKIVLSWGDNTSDASPNKRRQFREYFRRLLNRGQSVYRFGYVDADGNWLPLYSFTNMTVDAEKPVGYVKLTLPAGVDIAENELRGYQIYVKAIGAETGDYMLVEYNEAGTGGSQVGARLSSERGVTLDEAGHTATAIHFMHVKVGSEAGQTSTVHKFFDGGVNEHLPIAGYSLELYETWEDVYAD